MYTTMWLIPLGQGLCVCVSVSVCVSISVCVQGMVHRMSVLCNNLICVTNACLPVLTKHADIQPMKRSTKIPCGSCKWIGAIVRMYHWHTKIFKLGCQRKFVRKWCFKHIREPGTDHYGSDVRVAFTQWSAVNHLHTVEPQATVRDNNTDNNG